MKVWRMLVGKLIWILIIVVILIIVGILIIVWIIRRILGVEINIKIRLRE
jgi:hypothetical protein